MKAILVGGALALVAGGCASPLYGAEGMNGLRVPAAARAAGGFVQGQAAEFIVSQQFILHSKNVGGDYLIQVAIPIPRPSPEMAAAKVDIVDRMFPNRDAAAIYVLDGGSDFPKFSTYRNQYVIGVQPMFSTWQEIYDTRWRDLTHEPVKDVKASGGGAKFAAFLTDELKPFIEKTYPVDPKKAVLAGYSLGGMFALRVLADDPQAYAGYLLGDASDIDRSVADRLRAGLSKADGVRVYYGVADLNRPGVRPLHDRLVAALNSAGPKLVLQVKEFAGETHGSAQAFVIAKGMDWMFSAAPLKPAG